MKPAAFKYQCPETVDSAIDTLSAQGEEAMVLAGGQSLIPQMNFRDATPQTVVDINGLDDLSYVRTEDSTLTIGALTRQSTARDSSRIENTCPLVTDALQYVGHKPTRHRGTIGGSMANADPRAELPAVATALDGSVVVRSANGERTLTAADFFEGNMSTAIESGELLTEVRFPIHDGERGYGFVEESIVGEDWAIVGVAAAFTVDDDTCQDVRLAYAGVDESPTRLAEAEAALEGEPAEEETFRFAAGEARENIDVSAQDEADSGSLRVNQAGGGDNRSATVHADAAYKRDLVDALTYRALERAFERT